MTKERILLIDYDLPFCRIIARYKSIFHFRNGIFSLIERIQLLHPDSEIIYFHPKEKIEKIFCIENQWQSFHQLYPEIAKECETKTNQYEIHNYLKNVFENHIIVNSFEIDILNLIDKIETHIVGDLKFLSRENFLNSHPQIQTIGNSNDIWIHKSVDSTSGVILDARKGPIILDENCKLTAFTYIEGPFYAGKSTYIDNARITGGVILGVSNRISGEVENSIFGNFSNKHHEGFVGHSIIGNWVNLGAITTTSDLKNNYGEVRLYIPLSTLPNPTENPTIISTKRIKFGSIIGDCVKTAIGTMLNTGTVIDIGCNVFGGSPSLYLPPFSWGIRGHKYEMNRYLKDCEKIFARRNQPVNTSFIELTKMYYLRNL